jgi:hypothetical protein
MATRPSITVDRARFDAVVRPADLAEVDDGSPRGRVFLEEIGGAAGFFTAAEGDLLRRMAGDPDAFLADGVVEDFFVLLGHKAEVTPDDEELLDSWEPYLVGDEGAALLFLWALKKNLARVGIDLELEGVELPRYPRIADRD